MEDAIQQLVDLGVTRGQAKKALSRYNNDVARAADFIFSGNDISDDEDEQKTVNDQVFALESSLPRENSMPVEEPPPPAEISVKKVSDQRQYDASQWSIVPFKPVEPAPPALITSTLSKPSLTWWKDPEDPSERLALDDLPIGLRPPSYNFSYSPVLLQALFHISAFQYAVLSYRPIPYSWGQPLNYWKGFGDAIPGYMIQKVVTRKQIPMTTPMTMSGVATPTSTSTGMETDENGKAGESEDMDMSEDEEEMDLDRPPAIVETIEPPCEFVEQVEDELMLMPKCIQTMSEMQKLFAFLGHTKRLYGNVSHFVRALNTKLTANGWDSSDKNYESFLDMLMSMLTEADDNVDNSTDLSFIPVFKNMFQVKARVEYGDDYEEEEIYYLISFLLFLNMDDNMTSFHECLDPLIFESDRSDQFDSDDEGYKFTTFKQIPPILTIVLDSVRSKKKKKLSYVVEKTIYMDRYLHENYDVALEGFKTMDQCRAEISKALKEMDKLKTSAFGQVKLNKADILEQTLSYFDQQKHDGSLDELETLRGVFGWAQNTIQVQMEALTASVEERRNIYSDIFNNDELKKRPYELRATFHHDGKSGTGHYWAYIWVEPDHNSSLESPEGSDTGGWFRFCDSQVTAATEDQILSEGATLFSMIYVDANVPKYSRSEIQELIPEELQKFINQDNELLFQEIYNHEHVSTSSSDAFVSAREEEDIIEKTQQLNLNASFNDIETSSIAAQDDVDVNSVGTAVGHNTDYVEGHHYSFTADGVNKLKDRVKEKIVEVSSYPSDDYRFIKSFEIFLARTQNQLALEHLYLLYSSEKLDVEDDAQFTGVDEESSKKDSELKLIWKEYDSYLEIAKELTRALTCFANKDYSHALSLLLDTKRYEASWKTQLMLDMDVSHAYSGLETFSFNNAIKKYGKACLQILNKMAYKKAINPAYRTRGLEDAIHLAYNAQTVIGPENVSTDSDYMAMGQLWLSFTEEREVTSLNNLQSDLLNRLVMTYLEGQSGGTGNHSRVGSPSQQEELSQLPLWEQYKLVCERSQTLLNELYS